ncbi:NUDIX hydrolase [Maribacter sp. CXY002]|uniref:NUDIX hydrolase n=1 Tax=Maribacter luteocoastalis TaxID=3407671 RepID=UPI003B66EA2B
MDELIDILDSRGKYTNTTAMKSEAHAKGLYHPTVHIWFYTAHGDVLIQQRAKNKDTHPLLWDVSVAGHIGAGEDIDESAIREVQEEIGLTIVKTDLEKIGVFKSIQRHSDDLIDCEFHHTFLCQLKRPFAELTKQESEVQQLSLIPLSTLENDILENQDWNRYVPHETTYYKKIFNSIKTRLK